MVRTAIREHPVRTKTTASSSISTILGPDILQSPSWNDYNAGRDPVLGSIIADMRGCRGFRSRPGPRVSKPERIKSLSGILRVEVLDTGQPKSYFALILKTPVHPAARFVRPSGSFVFGS